MRLAYQRASASLTDAIGSNGLTPTQFATLLRLDELGPQSQNELGRSVGMPPANIHATVRRLLADGLVTTAPSPTDRRLALVDLTAAGRAKLREVLPAATAANADTLAALADDEQELLMSLLRALAASAELTATPRTSATGSSGLRAPSP